MSFGPERIAYWPKQSQKLPKLYRLLVYEIKIRFIGQERLTDEEYELALHHTDTNNTIN